MNFLISSDYEDSKLVIMFHKNTERFTVNYRFAN